MVYILQLPFGSVFVLLAPNTNDYTAPKVGMSLLSG